MAPARRFGLADRSGTDEHDRPGSVRARVDPAEESIRVEVTAIDNAGDHNVFALYKGGGRPGVPRPAGGPGFGRYFRPDELEVIPEPP